jgi:hypothetical protein
MRRSLPTRMQIQEPGDGAVLCNLIHSEWPTILIDVGLKTMSISNPNDYHYAVTKEAAYLISAIALRRADWMIVTVDAQTSRERSTVKGFKPSCPGTLLLTYAQIRIDDRGSFTVKSPNPPSWIEIDDATVEIAPGR